MGTISSTYAAFWNSAISSPSLSNVALYQSNGLTLTCLQSATDIRFDIAGNAVMYIEDDGASISGSLSLVGSGANLTVAGNSTVSGTKSWSIAHPTQPGKLLQHGCVEAPEQGVNLVRMTCDPTEAGTSDWALPDWYTYVNQDNAQCWCQADEHFGRAYAKLVEGSLQLTCETPGRYHVLILATRAGDFGWELEPDA